MIVLSNAHHRRWQGAVNETIGMTEYIYSVEINRRIINLFTMDENFEDEVYLVDQSWKVSYRESLREKVRVINSFKPVLAIENHLNSFDNPEATGCECLFYKDSIPGAKLAEIIQTNLTGLRELKPDRGIQERTDVMFLRATTCPAVITEPLFLSHKSSVLLLDEKFLDKLAQALFKGIKDFLEEN